MRRPDGGGSPGHLLVVLQDAADTGQQMRNFAARFYLPRETFAQAFELQSQLDRLTRGRSVSFDASGLATIQTGTEGQAELQGQLQQLLRPELWQAWQAGKNLRVKLDP